MGRRIAVEDRLAFYRRILNEAGTSTKNPECMNEIIRFLHDHLDLKAEFMRYTRVSGQSNLFFIRVQRMINSVQGSTYE